VDKTGNAYITGATASGRHLGIYRCGAFQTDARWIRQAPARAMAFVTKAQSCRERTFPRLIYFTYSGARSADAGQTSLLILQKCVHNRVTVSVRLPRLYESAS